jgi:membrane protease YdiL (CAAX protease family)
MTMDLAVIAGGALAEATAWRLVARRRGDVWRIMPPTLVCAGAAAALARRPVASANTRLGVAAAAGAAAGGVLYAATRGFVALARRWDPFRRHTAEAYAAVEELGAPRAAAVSLVIVVGEELFWRGLVQPRLSSDGALAGAVRTWAGFAAVNAASESLPIIAGGVVGGAAWAALAAWTGGVLASVACHGTWTVLMIVRPPVRPAAAV